MKNSDKKASITIEVNNIKHELQVDNSTLLADLLRDNLRLTGTHIGCDTAQCGACTLIVDGKSVKSCCVLAADCDGSKITTIEGLAYNGKLHPIQEAFKKNHGLQCGFCTPGMIMAGIDIIRRHGKNLDEKTVRRELDGNLCRCTGYQNIVASILEAAKEMSKETA